IPPLRGYVEQRFRRTLQTRAAQAGVAAHTRPARSGPCIWKGEMAMDSINRLAFAAAMLGATTLWMAGRPAVMDQSDPLNPGAAPWRFTQATRAPDGASDCACEDNAEEDPDDS